MRKVVQFKRPGPWGHSGIPPRKKSGYKKLWRLPGLSPLPIMLVLSGIFLAYFYQSKQPVGETTSVSFGMCGHGNWYNCVVDGDTFYLQGQSIRIADIDAPETHPSRCAHEADLGNKATNRLYDLLNAGPFEMKSLLTRDRDKYGRKLRVIVRDGHSLGGTLVSEGLARQWTGHRLPWCS